VLVGGVTGLRERDDFENFEQLQELEQIFKSILEWEERDHTRGREDIHNEPSLVEVVTCYLFGLRHFQT
jgi:hypothetical protein